MNDQQRSFFDRLVSIQEKYTKEAQEYWSMYSGLDTWQFWVIVLMLVVPLIVLIFAIDRKRIFIVGFFGFAVHMLFSYVDAIGIRFGLWEYPYQLLPFLPSFSLDGSIIPIAIMLVFQWTLKHDKNFYLYATLLAIVFGFGFKPLLTAIGLFESYKWVNFFYIFLIYLLLYIGGYLVTRLFMKWQEADRE
ncbi:CBO0543 family protein [Niallia sp.]|uniref:CBO0543 family protein n=1 Tax=Niallia sp. TaxID=2837523 RepID=UPI00289F10C2|nr:CBO0543 family protein [Niallia sp.]